ncbi:MAG: MerR family transcriptional regulator [Planctomycetota bacterium]
MDRQALAPADLTDLDPAPALRLVGPDPSRYTLDEARDRFLAAPPPKLYKVGELAAYTGLTRQTIHNYTRWSLIHEAGWTAGGHRLYPASVFRRLRRILQLRRDRTVPEIRAILDRELSPTPAA